MGLISRVSSRTYRIFKNIQIMNRSRLIAVIGDEDTVTGFLLGGIGEQNKQGKVNFKICNKDTPVTDNTNTLKEFIHRKDVAIILITQTYAELVRNTIDAHIDPI